jgi:hypothetical protein
MIVKVTAPNSVPTDISDYQAQNAHMMAFMNQVNMQAFILTNPTVLSKPKVAQGTYISHGGSLYKVDSTDEDISGSPSDGKVYIRVTGDATLTASFITDISGYTYNHAYGALTNGNYTLLPYELRKSGSDWLKYRFDILGTTDQNLRTTDNVNFNTVNTGQGDNKLYRMNQNVRTTDNVAFNTVNTGQGATEVHLMNQNLRTTDSPTFAKLKLTTSTYGSKSVSGDSAWVVPVGIYVFAPTVGILVQVWTGSAWVGTAGPTITIHGALISDGSNIRIVNGFSSSQTLYYRKFS